MKLTEKQMVEIVKEALDEEYECVLSDVVIARLKVAITKKIANAERDEGGCVDEGT